MYAAIDHCTVTAFKRHASQYVSADIRQHHTTPMTPCTRPFAEPDKLRACADASELHPRLARTAFQPAQGSQEAHGGRRVSKTPPGCERSGPRHGWPSYSLPRAAHGIESKTRVPKTLCVEPRRTPEGAAVT